MASMWQGDTAVGEYPLQVCMGSPFQRSPVYLYSAQPIIIPERSNPAQSSLSWDGPDQPGPSSAYLKYI